MKWFSKSFSVNFISGIVGLTAYIFWAENYGNLYFFALRVYASMAENWFLAFALLGGFLLHALNLVFVFVLTTTTYILFLAWPEISPEQMLLNVSSYTGQVTLGSVLLSPDEFRAYAMLIAVAFFDVINLATAREE